MSSQVENENVKEVDVTSILGRFVQLLPEEISEPEHTNVRPFSSKEESERDIQEINELAASIKEEGQLQPVRVARIEGAEEGQPQYRLIAGRRRRRAVMLLNLAAAEGQEPLRLDCVVKESVEGEKKGKTEAREFRQAYFENALRKNANPIDDLMNMQLARRNFKWEGAEGTKKLAAFLKCSPAQVYQTEKIATLPDEIQALIKGGELSRDDAYRLIKIQESAGPLKALESMKIALGEAEAVEVAAEVEAHVESGGKKKKAGKKKAAVAVVKKKAAARSASLKKAEREAAEKSGKGKGPARNKKEIMEFFDGLQGPAYGYPDGAVWKFVDALNRFAAGELSGRALNGYFDTMVQKADRGTAASVEVVGAEKSEPKSKKKPSPKK